MDLIQPEGILQRLELFLSQEEQERAARFHFGYLRRRFIAGRGILRTILAVYLHTHPGRVSFEYSAFGKPGLGGDFQSNGLSFNLAHSHELALAAVTRGRLIGVDIESQSLLADADEIASRYFASEEFQVFRQLPSQMRQAAFFTCWTRKESFIKAIGEGLSYPLDRFCVTFTPGEPARLLHIDGNVQAASRWSLYSLQPGNGYVAAMVVEGQDHLITCFHWAHTLLR
jgi:4'-phosphopantetheinyl transferase